MNKELLNLLEQQAKLQGQHMWFCVACTSGSVVFGSMLKSLENKVDKNAEEIAAVKDAQADLENKTTNLEDRVKTVEKEKSATVQQCENAVLDELNKRESRKKNIVLYNVTESNKDRGEERKKDDLKALDEVFNTMDLDVNTKEDVTFITRIGEKNPSKQRPLMFGCCSELLKSDILKRAKLLANTDFEHISVVPDLTKKQRQTEAEKRKLMEQRNADMSPEQAKNFVWRMHGERGKQVLKKVPRRHRESTTRAGRGRGATRDPRPSQTGAEQSTRPEQGSGRQARTVATGANRTRLNSKRTMQDVREGEGEEATEEVLEDEVMEPPK